jgi:hypothetical protein
MAPLDGAQLAGGQRGKSGFGILGFFLGIFRDFENPKIQIVNYGIST